MKKNILIVLCVLLNFCFSGCVIVNIGDLNAVSGKGAPEKYDINVGEYNKINVEGYYCEVQYNAASSNTVNLEIQPNLREYFVVEVQNGELIIRTTKKISGSSVTPVISVSTPVLNSLNIAGECTFKANDKIKADVFDLKISGAGEGKAELDVKSLKVKMSGTGDFTLSGKADIAEIDLSGVGDLDAFSFQVREASIDFSGVGTLQINSSEKLNINGDGTGTVEYKGSPIITVNKSGLVSIEKVD